MNPKRKRCSKTSVFQYESYLSYMEESYIFRSGIINPTVPENFISKKWEELTQILNSCDVGPILSTAEWQKRFNNWKNSTRQKYRQIMSDQKGTGGGPNTERKLTTLEERGLSVWGRVAVTGTPKVMHAGGLQNEQSEKEVIVLQVDNETPEESNYEVTFVDDGVVFETEANETQEGSIVIADDSSSTFLQHADTPCKPAPSTPSFVNSTQNNLILNRKRKFKANSSSKTVKDIGAELLKSYQENCSAILGERQKQCDCEREKIKLEKVKLKFEIAKYKFANPGFHFDESELFED